MCCVYQLFLSRDRCYCSNTPGNLVDESKCNRACTGFQSEKCGGGTLFFSLMGTGRFKLIRYIRPAGTKSCFSEQKLLWMEATLSGLNGAPVTPTAGILGIEPAPALHLYLEELNVMGRQEKNLQVYAMEGTAVLEVKQKCSLWIHYHFCRFNLCWLF